MTFRLPPLHRPLLALLAALGLASAAPAKDKPPGPDPMIAKILPVPAPIRKIFDQNCVLCHGEVVDGRAEERGGFSLIDDAAIRESLSSAGKLKQMILEDKMPQKPKVSKRLRDHQPYADRVAAVKAGWDQHGEKAAILAWLKDVTATTGDDDD